MKKRILVVDDEEAIRFSLHEGLTHAGYNVRTATSGEECLETLKEWTPHLLLLDLRLTGKNGFQVLRDVKQLYPSILVIMMTAYGDTKGAVEAIKLGAINFLDKPFDFDNLLKLLDESFDAQRIKKEWEYYHDRHKQELITNQLVGQSKVMNEVRRKLETVAQSYDTSVLLYGETGTGKEVAARSLHSMSTRKDKPFIDINCGAIPHNLIESELFGYEKNAFTGAGQGKKGLFELADGGTIFLDEIGEMPLDMQVKLLRFLETQVFRRVGGRSNLFVDVRVIAATNQDLRRQIEAGSFRKDLYYRLNVFPISLPPLRERQDDIIPLAKHFWKELKTDATVEKVLKEYYWPGNVRELKNLMELLSILHPNGKVYLKDLPSHFLHGSGLKTVGSPPENAEAIQLRKLHPGGLQEEIERIEKDYIQKALDETRWNISEAARLLKLSRHALQRRVNKYFPK